jgi:hypothetical protein
MAKPKRTPYKSVECSEPNEVGEALRYRAAQHERCSSEAARPGVRYGWFAVCRCLCHPWNQKKAE